MGTRLRTAQRAASAGRDRLDARLRRRPSAWLSRRSGSGSRPSGRPSTTSSMTGTCPHSSSSARRWPRRRRGSSSARASSSRRCTTRSVSPRMRPPSSCSATAGWSWASGWAGRRWSSTGSGPTRAAAVRPWTRSCASCRRRGAVSRSRTRAPSSTSRRSASGPGRRPRSRSSSAVVRSRRSAVPRASPTGSSPTPPVEEFIEQVRWVLDECERIGRDPSTFRFIHYSVLLPGASREEALGRYRDALWAMQWKYSDMEASATRPLPPPAPPPPSTGARTSALVRGPGDVCRDPRRARRGPARHPGAGRGTRRVRRPELLPAPRVRGAGRR